MTLDNGNIGFETKETPINAKQKWDEFQSAIIEEFNSQMNVSKILLKSIKE